MKYSMFASLIATTAVAVISQAAAEGMSDAASPATTASPIFRQYIAKKDPSAACQLEKFTLLNNYPVEGTDSFSGMTAVINTTNPNCIHDYGVVQWIRGCVFTQNMDPTTKRLGAKTYMDTYSNRTNTTDFHLPNWQIDSYSADPMYYAKDVRTDTGERMGFYYVSKIPLGVTKESYAADEKEIQSHADSRVFLENAGNMSPIQTYVTDMPVQASIDGSGDDVTVTTPSLEFKTCVYETKDVPMTGNPASAETPHAQGGPIVCYDWTHKYTYNPAKHAFDHTPTAPINAFCQ